MKNKIHKNWQSRDKSVEELHRDSILWISEINFIKDEIRFLEHLLTSNYIDCLSKGLFNKIRRLVYKMSDERVIGKTLEVIIKEQEIILSDLIKANSVSSNKNYLENHRKLEMEMNSFMLKYKRLKKQIFEIVENVMKEKDQKKLA